MGLIRDMIPLNLKEERDMFLRLKGDYNPQFRYVRTFKPEEFIYTFPSEELFLHSLHFLNKSKDIAEKNVDMASPGYVKSMISSLTKSLGIPDIDIIYDERISTKLKINGNKLIIKSTDMLSKDDFENRVNHEIQTHYLRSINQEKTKIKSDEKTRPLEFRATEEGLATLHSYLKRSNKVLTKTYLNYAACWWSLQLPFKEVAAKLMELGVGLERAWRLVLLQKRGVEDTRNPGIYFKTHTYFVGVVYMSNWVMKNDPRRLYNGRISYIEANSIENVIPDIILPTFLSSVSDYRNEVGEIIKANNLENVIGKI